MKSLFLILFITVCLFANAQVSGCTDPLATNYNTEATINDGSCTYGTSTVSAAVSHELPEIIEETSGLIYWNNSIWTHNDDTDINLYSFDFENVENYNTYELTGTQNIDQEEISQDSNYIYIGDFGNNVSGNRTNLQILRIEKQSLLDGTPIIDTISFVYSNQTNFEATEANKTDFDCEAFIVSTDSIYLFTKQWVSKKTAVYSLSKYPGEHIAHYKNEFNVNGLITGAVFNRAKRCVVLCGYSSLMQPFFYLLYDFNGNDFFSGNKRKISFSSSLHQVEGVTTKDGLTYYASNEKLSQSFITIAPKIHEVDLSTYLSDYLNSIIPDENAPVISSTHNDVDLYADNNCNAMVPDYRGDVTASDDITPEANLIIVQSPNSGSYISSGNNQISLRVYDESDNFDEIFFNINVLDTISPTIIVEDININIEATENCNAAIPDFSESLTLYDNCTANENLVLTQNPVSGSLCSGINNEVILTLTDESNNETQTTLYVSVIDTSPPTINCPTIEPITIENDELSYTVIGTEFDPEDYSDNCSTPSITNNYNSSSSLANAEFNIGTTTVLWTATDEAGNSNTCSYDITINSTDITTENISGLSIYPNPAKDKITIQDKNLVINNLTLTDINGKYISIFANKENTNYHLDISKLSSGIYFLNIETRDKANLKYKIIKQ
ncbi:MAG: HYR domain-containing protein [Bacteroidales bacterium]|nr:HYR domain-containing protein [Bacteroidales bacterium]